MTSSFNSDQMSKAKLDAHSKGLEAIGLHFTATVQRLSTVDAPTLRDVENIISPYLSCINKDVSEHEYSPLVVCLDGPLVEALLLIILAHPDIEVNRPDSIWEHSVQKLMMIGHVDPLRYFLRHPKFSLAHMTKEKYTTATETYMPSAEPDILKTWIAFGPDEGVNEPHQTSRYSRIIDAIRERQARGYLEDNNEWWSVALGMYNHPKETRERLRRQMGYYDMLAAEMFVWVVFFTDGYMQLADEATSEVSRFLKMASKLPVELQMTLCNYVVGSPQQLIPLERREFAFGQLSIPFLIDFSKK